MNDPLRILIVEDQPTDVELIEHHLSQGAIQCVIRQVDTRVDFLNALETFKPELILSDYMLPSFDGLEALALARDRCPETPFILVSGTMGEELAVESIKRGATDYLLKDRLARLGPSITRALREAEALGKRKLLKEQFKATQAQLVQAEKLSAVGQLAIGVAHEVKNPLQIITQAVDYLADELGPEGGRAQEAIGAIKDAVRRADRIVRELLRFSRPATLQLKPGRMRDVVESALALVGKQLQVKNVELTVDVPEALPMVEMDENQLQQVFINLILNSFQAMPEGGRLTLRASARPVTDEEAGRHAARPDAPRAGEPAVFCEVSDSGVGIPSESLKKLFEPFFTTKPVGQGTGLGLSITRTLIEAHHGWIEVASERGRGTTMTLVFPASRSASILNQATISAAR